jgi:hypothetical protein
MLYAVLCYGQQDVVCALSKEEDDAVMADVSKVAGQFAAEGKLGPSLRLMPTTAATTIAPNGETLTIDGPFAETKEQLLGIWILDCASQAEAVEAARRLAPVRGPGSGPLEVRPIRMFNAGTAVPGIAASEPEAPAPRRRAAGR